MRQMADLTITINAGEYAAIMAVLDLTGARYEGRAKNHPNLAQNAAKFRKVYENLKRYWSNR
jgi:hypothetical protein